MKKSSTIYLINKLIIFLIISSLTFGIKTNFIDETLYFNVGFRIFNAGEAVLSIKKDTLNNNTAYLLSTNIKTNSFLSNFYKVNDKIFSWLSPKDLSLLKTSKTIRQGSFKRDYISIIKGDSLAISANNIITLPDKVYDPISFIYFLRLQSLNIGDSFHFHSYEPNQIKEVFVHITKKEVITVPAGKFNCYKAEPTSKDGNALFTNDGVMRVWISDDSLNLPVKIEQNTNIGTMVMKLKYYK